MGSDTGSDIGSKTGAGGAGGGVGSKGAKGAKGAKCDCEAAWAAWALGACRFRSATTPTSVFTTLA